MSQHSGGAGRRERHPISRWGPPTTSGNSSYGGRGGDVGSGGRGGSAHNGSGSGSRHDNRGGGGRPFFSPPRSSDPRSSASTSRSWTSPGTGNHNPTLSPLCSYAPPSSPQASQQKLPPYASMSDNNIHSNASSHSLFQSSPKHHGSTQDSNNSSNDYYQPQQSYSSPNPANDRRIRSSISSPEISMKYADMQHHQHPYGNNTNTNNNSMMSPPSPKIPSYPNNNTHHHSSSSSSNIPVNSNSRYRQSSSSSSNVPLFDQQHNSSSSQSSISHHPQAISSSSSSVSATPQASNEDPRSKHTTTSATTTITTDNVNFYNKNSKSLVNNTDDKTSANPTATSSSYSHQPQQRQKSPYLSDPRKKSPFLSDPRNAGNKSTAEASSSSSTKNDGKQPQHNTKTATTTHRSTIPSPPPGPPSSYAVDFCRLVDAVANMDHAYAKYLLLTKEHAKVVKELRFVETLPIGEASYKEELEALKLSSPKTAVELGVKLGDYRDYKRSLRNSSRGSLGSSRERKRQRMSSSGTASSSSSRVAEGSSSGRHSIG